MAACAEARAEGYGRSNPLACQPVSKMGGGLAGFRRAVEEKAENSASRREPAILGKVLTAAISPVENACPHGVRPLNTRVAVLIVKAGAPGRRRGLRHDLLDGSSIILAEIARQTLGGAEQGRGQNQEHELGDEQSPGAVALGEGTPIQVRSASSASSDGCVAPAGSAFAGRRAGFVARPRRTRATPARKASSSGRQLLGGGPSMTGRIGASPWSRAAGSGAPPTMGSLSRFIARPRPGRPRRRRSRESPAAAQGRPLP